MGKLWRFITKKKSSKNSGLNDQLSRAFRASKKQIEISDFAIENIRKRIMNQIEAEKFATKLEPKKSFRSMFSAFQKVAASFTLVAMVGTVALTVLVFQASPAAAEVGKISIEIGSVKIREAQKTFFESIDREATVKVGDTIRVDENSTAKLSFYDASEMHLTEQTEVEIKEFSENAESLGKSGVKVALIAGSVSTVVEKEDGAGAFEIETSTSVVGAQNAKFSVTIDSETGETEVETTEESVAVTTLNEPESQELVAGQKAVISGETVLLAATNGSGLLSEFQLPTIDELKLTTDLIQIRFFDALIMAQKGEAESAQKIQAQNQKELKSLAVHLGAGDIQADHAKTLSLVIQDTYLDSPQRTTVINNLSKVKYVEEILSYYYVSPRLMHGMPEFELLPDHYKAPARMRNLLAILKVYQLGRIDEVRSAVDALTTLLAADLVEVISEGDIEKLAVDILKDMNQPIYLFSLTKMRELIPEEGAAAVEAKIAELKTQVDAYIGVAN